MFWVSMLFSHTLLDSLDMAVAAFPVCLLISASKNRLLVMVDPRLMNSSTSSRVWSSVLTAGASLTFCPITLVFFRFMVRTYNVHAWTSWSMGVWRPSSLSDISVTSSAKSSISLVKICRTLVFERRQVM